MAIPGLGGLVMLAVLGPFLDLADHPRPPRHRVRVEARQPVYGIDARDLALALRLPAPGGRAAVEVRTRRAGTLHEDGLRVWWRREPTTTVFALGADGARRSAGEMGLKEVRLLARLTVRAPVSGGELAAGLSGDAPLGDDPRVPPAAWASMAAWSTSGWGVAVARLASRYGAPARWAWGVRLGGRGQLILRRTDTGVVLAVAWSTDRSAAVVWMPVAGFLPPGPGLRLGWGR